MKKLLAAKTAFGIIPGGSEDVAIHEHGKENVYINSRYGFIKYALQHGYCLILAYTFGENDQYYSLSCLRPLNLWLVKRFSTCVERHVQERTSKKTLCIRACSACAICNP